MSGTRPITDVAALRTELDQLSDELARAAQTTAVENGAAVDQAPAVAEEVRERVLSDLVEALAYPSSTNDEVDAELRELLMQAEALLGSRLPAATLELLRRAASVIAYESIQGRPITTVEALRVRIAPWTNHQPAPGGAPRRAIGHDTVRTLLSEDVADVVAVAMRLAWFRADPEQPTALTIFSTALEAIRDSHAPAAQHGRLPIIGIGIGSSDSFLVSGMHELVHAVLDDPVADARRADEHGRLEVATAEESLLPNLEQIFLATIAEDARQRDLVKSRIQSKEVDRLFPRDVVVQRLPHGPYDLRLGTPAGEFMSREHPAMRAVLERYGYRGVLAYHEELRHGAPLKKVIERVTDLEALEIRELLPGDLDPGRARAWPVDMWDVNHYAVTGRDKTGAVARRVVRHALYDGRLTVFDTVGFDDETMHEAVVLAEYATANLLRKSSIESFADRMQPGRFATRSLSARAGLRRLVLLTNAAMIAAKRKR